MKLGQGALAALIVALSACEAGSSGNAGAAGGGGSGTGAASSSGPSSGGGGSVGTFGGAGAEGGSGGGVIPCTPGGPDDDVDQDGFTPNQGDCEDCDPRRSPNAIEVPTPEGEEPFDEDCDDEIDEVEEKVLCDEGIAIDEMDPLAAAAAIDICKTSTGEYDWGVVSAAWVMADGSPPPSDVGDLANFHRGHGFLDDFGANLDVREGVKMLALSSGSARRPNDPGYASVEGFNKGYTGGFAQGFPKESAACPGSITGTVNDPTGVELVIRTPANATGFSFDFDFYTFEWPGFVCSTYNDFFLAILDPIPEGQLDGNISFDGDLNPISVNNALLEVCGCEGNPPGTCEAGGKIFECSLGNIELIGTGFGFDTTNGDDHGATGWLRTTAPVPGNAEISVRFAVHDSGDGSLDSTTLVDNFQWIAKPGTQVGTNPVPQ